MISANLYPGGVILRSDPQSNRFESHTKLIITRPDAKVVELYKSNFSSFVNNDSFEYNKDVVETCIRLYGNFYKWLQFQLNYNKFIHGTNRDFLIDTLWYIKTGERKMMLPVWESIITQYPDMSPNKIIDQLEVMEHSFLSSQSNSVNPYSNYITEWTSHPDGVYDMLYTTYLLFGHVNNNVMNSINFTN